MILLFVLSNFQSIKKKIERVGGDPHDHLSVLTHL